MEHDEHNQFNKEIKSFYNDIPRKAKLLSRQDINANDVIRSKMFRDLLVQQLLDNHKVKGKDIFFLLKSNKFIVLLTYFKLRNYATW